MKTILSVCASFFLGALAFAQSQARPATVEGENYYVRGNILRNRAEGIFVEKAKGYIVGRTGSDALESDGRHSIGVHQKTSSPGLPEVVLIKGHPWAARLAEKDKVAATIRYTGVTEYMDEYKKKRTVHTYEVIGADDPLEPPPQKKPAYKNPLDQKPKR